MYQRLFSFLLLTLLLPSCKFYHDVAAKYNAYFLANERMKEVEQNLFGKHQNNYHEVLQVLVKLDTNMGKSEKANLDYAIKKASRPIAFHKSSKWVDDCYVVIGKARLYQGDFGNAVNTFKWVNTNTPDDHARHTALVQLLRTFIEMGEYNNAEYVLEYIGKESTPFNDPNTRDYHLVMAHYYRLQDSLPMVAAHLEAALPLVRKKRERARLHYILAQIYDLDGDSKMAHEHYSFVLRHNPDHELEFNARLMSYNVREYRSDEEAAKIERYYESLLKDLKNFEYRDRIYYEMGEFKYGRKDIDKAFEYYTESAHVSSNRAQKGYSYLRMAQIYEEHKGDYEAAAAYYDSTMQVMPATVRGYAALKKRAELMKDLAKHIRIIREQDRLLAMSRMSRAELDVFLDKEIEQEREAIIQRQSQLKEIALKRQPPPSATAQDNNTFNSAARQGENVWYFYNPQAISAGTGNFLRVWGNRPLADHWRRSQRSDAATATDTRSGDAKPGEALAGSPASDSKKAGAAQDPNDPFASIRSKEARIIEIPNTPERIAEATKKIEDALFESGKLFFYGLKEGPGTLRQMGRLTSEFVESPHCPEALYILYTLCKEQKACDPNLYRDMLYERYPQSFYANLLRNPNYQQDLNIADAAAAQLYEKAYEAYRRDQIELSASLVGQLLREHPKHSHADKVKVLQAMVLAKQGDMPACYAALTRFMQDYPDSPLKSIAQTMLAKISPEHQEKGKTLLTK